MYTSDKEALILEYIYNNDSLKQRELAEKADISLGMVNAILKRLIEKGWLMTKRVNSRNVSYIVSPAGVEEIFKRGYQYFKRTIDDVILYKESIEQLVEEAVASGHTAVVLVGKSDLDFLVEYACGKAGVEFNKADIAPVEDSVFVLYGEQHEASGVGIIFDKKQWLRNVVIKKA